jgi:hypothetical protein
VTSVHIPTYRLRRLSVCNGISFIFACIALMMLLILGVAIVQMGIHDVRDAGVYKRRIQCQQLAEAAIDRGIWMMQLNAQGDDNINYSLSGAGQSYTSPTWVTTEGDSYSFTATAPYNGIANTVLMNSRGVSANGETEQLRVIAVYMPLVFDGFSHALFSDHNLSLGGDTYINGHPELGGKGIYANGNVTYVGNSSTTVGNIEATGSISGNTDQQPSAYQDLNGDGDTNDPGEQPAVKVEYGPHISFPEIDLDWYETHADLYYNGTVTLNGGILGTWDDPKIIFVDGQVKMSGIFQGVGTIVSTKGFRITGNCEYADGNSGLALLTTGEFRMAGTADVFGLVYAHSVLSDASFVGTGTPTIVGSVVADTISVNGTIDVHYDPRLKDIKGLPGHKGQVDVLAWERL